MATDTLAPPATRASAAMWPTIVGYTSPCLPWRQISNTCFNSLSRNGWKCKPIYMLLNEINHAHCKQQNISQILRFMGPTRGPPGSCRPQVGPMLAPWTLLSGITHLGPRDSIVSSIPINGKYICPAPFTPHSALFSWSYFLNSPTTGDINYDISSTNPSLLKYLQYNIITPSVLRLVVEPRRDPKRYSHMQQSGLVTWQSPINFDMIGAHKDDGNMNPVNLEDSEVPSIGD